MLTVEHLTSPDVHDVSFELRRGEVLGFAGLVGAGRTEVARLLFGADPRTGGTVRLDGIPIHPRSPREAIEAGIGLLTEDRNRQGLFFNLDIRSNISMAALHRVAGRILLDHSSEARTARGLSERLRIKSPGLDIPVAALSGGNRQKVVLARWLMTSCRVLIFDEPTAGIDVGARQEIYELIEQLASDGIGIILISSDLPELLGICGRILVMGEGRLRGVLARSEATQERILTLASPAS